MCPPLIYLRPKKQCGLIETTGAEAGLCWNLVCLAGVTNKPMTVLSNSRTVNESTLTFGYLYYLSIFLINRFFLPSSLFSAETWFNLPKNILNMPVDLLHPTPESEQRTHKLKRLVQSPNSYFMDIKCPGCFQITTVFSHAQTVVLCGNCNIMLCQPTGGKARLTEGCSYRKKVD